MRAAMDARVIDNSDALAALAPEWLDLWRRSPNATPFQSPMWLLPWWRHFGSNELNVITVRENNRLVGFAPLYVLRDEDESLGLFLGTGISDYLDVLGDAPFDLTNIDCQMWDFQQLRPSSAVLRLSLAEGWSDNVEDQEPCLVLPLSDLKLSTHFQKKLRYYKRSLGCTFEDANAVNLDTLLDALFTLHAARWQRRGTMGMLADDVVQQFHREAARAMLAEGALRMFAMRSAERIIAVFYGFAHQKTVYYYLSGYDPQLEKFSPGTVLVGQAIETAIGDGATTFDFLRGAEAYKYAWGAKDRTNVRRQIFKV